MAIRGASSATTGLGEGPYGHGASPDLFPANAMTSWRIPSGVPGATFDSVNDLRTRAGSGRATLQTVARVRIDQTAAFTGRVPPDRFLPSNLATRRRRRSASSSARSNAATDGVHREREDVSGRSSRCCRARWNSAFSTSRTRARWTIRFISHGFFFQVVERNGGPRGSWATMGTRISIAVPVHGRLKLDHFRSDEPGH